MRADARLRRTEESDARLRALLEEAVTDASGVALVAVGGYGRRELSPQSDLDAVLLHADDRADVATVADRVWYPLWDDGVRLDHAVRTLDEMAAAAADDVRTALGLLDARHVAGDPTLTLQLRARVLAAWRATARHRLPELREEGRTRAERSGDVAYSAVPDLKESRGGLRDGVDLRALVASWLVDLPHTELERCRRGLLDVRDGLHHLTGRPGDRLLPEMMPELAEWLGVPDPAVLHRHVRGLGRRLAHLGTLTWRRLDDVLDHRPRAGGVRRPSLHPLADGVSRSGGEVVLDHRARPDRDPLLMLRTAAAAAEHGLLPAPATATRLGRRGRPLPTPWPAPARDLLVRLLGAGPSLVPVWETLEEVEAVGALLPEWEEIRLLPSSAPVHRFTVDRHSLETCVQAAPLLRRVRRPDLLLVAALLHDLGKGRGGDHSRVGASLTRRIGVRWGFSAADADLVAGLVRHHLLLPHTATRRDLEDAATARGVAAAVGTPETLDLLAALTEADARATGPAAWTPWRARLVGRLVELTRAALEAADGGTPTAPVEPVAWPTIARDARAAPHSPVAPVVDTETHPDGTVVQVGATDRVGLLADVAAALALSGLEVRSARVGSQDGFGWSRWLVADTGVDARRVRQRLRAVLEGGIDPAARLCPPPEELPGSVVSVQHDASASATVIEVRDRVWRGRLPAVCAALAACGADVRSAHLQTIGLQAVDTFYVCDGAGRPLSPERADGIAKLVRDALRT